MRKLPDRQPNQPDGVQVKDDSIGSVAKPRVWKQGLIAAARSQESGVVETRLGELDALKGFSPAVRLQTRLYTSRMVLDLEITAIIIILIRPSPVITLSWVSI